MGCVTMTELLAPGALGRHLHGENLRGHASWEAGLCETRGSSQPWSPRHLLCIKYSTYTAYLPRFLPLLLQEVPFLPTFHCVVEVEHHPQTPAMTPVAHSRPSAPSDLPGTSSAPAPETVSRIGTQHRPHAHSQEMQILWPLLELVPGKDSLLSKALRKQNPEWLSCHSLVMPV